MRLAWGGRQHCSPHPSVADPGYGCQRETGRSEKKKPPKKQPTRTTQNLSWLLVQTFLSPGRGE